MWKRDQHGTGRPRALLLVSHVRGALRHNLLLTRQGGHPMYPRSLPKENRMEGDLGLGLVLLAFLFFGWGGLFTWRRFRRDKGAVDLKGAYPGDPKARVMGRVLDAVTRSITSNLERTEMSYHPGDPREVLTLIMDIEQFRHLRKHRGMMQYEGLFVERDIERRWARRPPSMREWEGIELVVPIAIKAAFDADVWINTVRFWVGDMENYALTICRVSVEAKRLQSPTTYDWRFDKRAKGYLAPVTPHGNRSPSLTAAGLAEDPYDFEQQVAQMLRGRGLTAEVTGGTGDEGVDIIAYDNTPVTGGMSLIQCKRYSPDKKVGVAEVRELYGTMQEKQSAKGVLVTSSTFTAGALKFAEGKSIELIDGVQLSELIVGTVQPVPDAPMVEPIPDVFLAAEYDFSGAVPKEGPKEDVMVTPPKGWLGEELSPTQLAFFVAVNEDDLEALKGTILNGADVNGRLDTGTTALGLAMIHGHTEIVAMLAASGADLENPMHPDGLTPLNYAVGSSRSEMAFLLLSGGADMNARNSGNGACPLDISIWRLTQPDANMNDLIIMQKLIEMGADTQSAYALAIASGLNEEIIKLLRPS